MTTKLVHRVAMLSLVGFMALWTMACSQSGGDASSETGAGGDLAQAADYETEAADQGSQEIAEESQAETEKPKKNLPDIANANLPKPGDRVSAPEFTLTDISGKSVNLSDFKGKVVILDFWATWCGPCKMEIPHFIDLYKEYKEHGLEIVGVALDRQGIAKVVPFVESKGIEYVSLIGNQQVVGLYGGVRSIPTTFVIDREGRIVSKHIGYRDKGTFEKEVVPLLKES